MIVATTVVCTECAITATTTAASVLATIAPYYRTDSCISGVSYRIKFKSYRWNVFQSAIYRRLYV